MRIQRHLSSFVNSERMETKGNAAKTCVTQNHDHCLKTTTFSGPKIQIMTFNFIGCTLNLLELDNALKFDS